MSVPIYSLYEEFKMLPSHWLHDVNVYSLNELLQVCTIIMYIDVFTHVFPGQVDPVRKVMDWQSSAQGLILGLSILLHDFAQD